MSGLYKIKPLRWDRSPYGSYHANVPFGSFAIERDDYAIGNNRWEVSFYFQSFDKDEAFFPTLRECKAWAAAEWDERMQMCLEEVGE